MGEISGRMRLLTASFECAKEPLNISKLGVKPVIGNPGMGVYNAELVHYVFSSPGFFDTKPYRNRIADMNKAGLTHTSRERSRSPTRFP